MHRDPSLDGDPQYVPQPFIDHTYAYGQARPPLVPVRRSDPRIGWWLVAAALLALAAAFLPWFHFVVPASPDPFGSVTTGDERGGLPTVLLSLVVLAAGAWISLGRRGLWSPIAALTASALSVFFVLLGLAGETVFNTLAFDNESTVVLAYGFWLEAVASVAALALSIMALARRNPVR